MPERFPFLSHRTIAEVARTVELGGRNRRNLTLLERAELLVLVKKAARNNPPPEPQRASMRDLLPPLAVFALALLAAAIIL